MNAPLYYEPTGRRTAGERAAARQARREAEAEQRRIGRFLGRLITPTGFALAFLEIASVESYGPYAGYLAGFLAGLALMISGMVLCLFGREPKR